MDQYQYFQHQVQEFIFKAIQRYLCWFTYVVFCVTGSEMFRPEIILVVLTNLDLGCF